jgi:hypothetical protein
MPHRDDLAGASMARTAIWTRGPSTRGSTPRCRRTRPRPPSGTSPGCARCSAAVAEARGLIAGASRILSALDGGLGAVSARAARPPSPRLRPARAPVASARGAGRARLGARGRGGAWCSRGERGGDRPRRSDRRSAESGVQHTTAWRLSLRASIQRGCRMSLRRRRLRPDARCRDARGGRGSARAVSGGRARSGWGAAASVRHAPPSARSARRAGGRRAGRPAARAPAVLARRARRAGRRRGHASLAVAPTPCAAPAS